MTVMPDSARKTHRRGFLADGARVAGALVFGSAAGFIAGRLGREEELVWQLDPDKCVACGNCATYCVLDISAVKCLNCFDICGYCDICTGYFEVDFQALDTGAENQLCPTGAVIRTFVEERAGQRFYEYTIEESLCIGCGKCVKGCALMNSSLYLQVMHDRCVNCNECSIAVACPSEAYRRVPASQPYLTKRIAAEALANRAEREKAEKEREEQEKTEKERAEREQA
jgi:electron transport complex protein RnfB